MPMVLQSEMAAGEPIRFDGFGGVPLIGECWGDKDQPAVLLLPGAGQSKRAYREAARALAQAGRWAVCVDLRGHGESGRPGDGRYDLDAFAQDVVAVLRQMNTRPVVIGASLGGMVALAALGESDTDLASALILVDAAPDIRREEAKRVRALMRRYSDGFSSLEEAAHAVQELSPRRQTPVTGEDLRGRLSVGPDGRLHWPWDEDSISGINAEQVAPRLATAAIRIKLPVLLIRGGESRIVSRAAIERLHGLLADAELVEIAGAGHLVSSDCSDDFNAVVLDFLERRTPREPALYTEGSDARTLRDALGCFATGVTIVTAAADAGPVGVTVNSFSAVSLDPPLVLFCLSNRSASLATFRAAGSFAINVLHIGQQPASAAFTSGPHEQRFDAVRWRPGDSGAPLIDGALASFECETHSTHEAGDHAIIVGRVRSAVFEPRRDPLLFFRGRYRRLHFS